MKKEKKEFSSLRRTVIRYNKALKWTFMLYIIYAILYSVSVLDCSGINFYTYTGKVTKGMLKCTNMSTGLLAFMRNNNLIICIFLLVIAIIFLTLQKFTLLSINRLEMDELEEEKVGKISQIIITLLLGYTGLHKYRTSNSTIGSIYSINFILFAIALVIKNFFEATYNNNLIFYCIYEFGLLFLIGITILNVIEVLFQLISLKDDKNRIYS